MNTTPLITDDTIVFGILMFSLGFVFYTSSSENNGWIKFYKIVPALLMVYLLPALFTSVGIIAPEWETINQIGEIVKQESNLYQVSSRYLLPAALILMTLSIDLKAMFNLGPKALIMFLTGTAGIIIGGPIAVLLISFISPETVGGVGPDAVWRGLATLAGSWIGGGANQAAMLEIYEYNPKKYGGMVLVDIIVANLWTAILLIGIGKSVKIDKWLKSDTSSIDTLKEKVSSYASKIERNPTLSDLIIILSIAFTVVGISHLGGNVISAFLVKNFKSVSDKSSAFSSFSSQFFWMISIATLLGITLSFTKFKKYEGAGASKIGSLFVYILVATIGMKMDLRKIVDNPGLILIGIVWMTVHALLLILVAKLIKAPFFFLAVGSQANVGGAASAPVIAAAFHPSLASVGVLLAVFGYVIGTYGAMLTAELMRIITS
ncbi:MAG: DUF819 family protein [Flavobacterium sp.]|uniref:DUF819 family protein n=1 Tax=Flavobacterium sp. TaxID=239 RepID=UPI0026157EE0|nr:DUF819 family protein [Flavobacterium sp.]MDD5150574.1 DUF819 family protein [Flavobacterium sp.]